MKMIEREAVSVRIEAYNAVSQMYQSGASSVKKVSGTRTAINDKLEISQAAKSCQTAREAVKKASDVRMDKVEDIKERMAAGTYNVSSEDIADKLLMGMNTIAF